MTGARETVDTRAFQALPIQRLERREGWAMLAKASSYVYRPSTHDQIGDILGIARRSGRTIALRGSGYSYGDLTLNPENVSLDLARMNRILEWDPLTGNVTVEPGVTVRQLWQHSLPDGWWPAVVPGTMYPTIGGLAAVNAHGKNNWRAGTIGDHIESFELLTVSGELVAADRRNNAQLFHAAIGGLGLLGIFTRLNLRLARVSSGLLRVEETAVGNLSEMFQIFRDRSDKADYLVGWIDGFASGAAVGRGLIQIANYVEDDPAPLHNLKPESQDLNDTIAGVVPRSCLWRAMKPAINDAGMRLLNQARFQLGRRQTRTSAVPHAQFHFFHDYVPNWKYSFRPGGIVQYQIFVPASGAPDVFVGVLSDAARVGLYPYLVVIKRHRRDSFLLPYNVDGYSLSLDFRCTERNEDRLRSMLRRFTRKLVLPAGGRFYAAKDDMLDSATVSHVLGCDCVNEFLEIRRSMDPEYLFDNQLARRWFDRQSQR